ncbi:unnamed protein product, partial [Rotaria sordida]
YIGCEPKAVQHWLARWQENEDLSNLQKSGRPRATSKKTDSKTVHIAKRERNITSNDISNILKNGGVDIDPSTVRRRLRESGGTYGSPLKKPLLTEKHREQRLIWARQHQHFNNKSSNENNSSNETIEEDLNMFDVGNVDKIIETSGVNTDYETSNENINTTSISNKESVIQEVETFHSNSSIEIDNKRKSDVDKENSDLVTTHNNNIDSLNNNGHIVTKEVATPITNPVDCFTTNNTFIRSSTKLASSSSNDVPFSSNEGSSIENPHSSALSCSSSISNTPKTVPPRQSKHKNVPRKNVT